MCLHNTRFLEKLFCWIVVKRRFSKSKWSQISSVFHSLLASLLPLPPFLAFLSRLMLPVADAKENVRDYLIAKREVIHSEELLLVEPSKSADFSAWRHQLWVEKTELTQLIQLWTQTTLMCMWLSINLEGWINISHDPCISLYMANILFNLVALTLVLLEFPDVH